MLYSLAAAYSEQGEYQSTRTVCTGPAGRQTASRFTPANLRPVKVSHEGMVGRLTCLLWLYPGSMKTVLQSPPPAVQTPLTLQYFPELLLASCSGMDPYFRARSKAALRAQLAPAWDGFLWCYLQFWMLHFISVSSQLWAEAITHPGRQPGWWTLRALPAAGPSLHPLGWNSGQASSPAWSSCCGTCWWCEVAEGYW